jgi:hypothetical protein
MCTARLEALGFGIAKPRYKPINECEDYSSFKVNVDDLDYSGWGRRGVL